MAAATARLPADLPHRPRSLDDSGLQAALRSSPALLRMVPPAAATPAEPSGEAERTASPRQLLSRSNSAEHLSAAAPADEAGPKSEQDTGVTAQASIKLHSKLTRVTFAASGSFHEGCSPTSPLPTEGLAEKFARAKVELDAELLSFAREAQALTEGVAQSADEAVLQELGLRLLALCRECRDQHPRAFELSCRGATYQLEQERRRAEGRIARSLVTRMLFSLTRCTRLLPEQSAAELDADADGGVSTFSFGTRRLSEELGAQPTDLSPLFPRSVAFGGGGSGAAAAAKDAPPAAQADAPAAPPAVVVAAPPGAAADVAASGSPDALCAVLPALRVPPPPGGRAGSSTGRLRQRTSLPGATGPDPAVRAAQRRGRASLEAAAAAAAAAHAASAFAAGERSPLPEGPSPRTLLPAGPATPPPVPPAAAAAAASLATPAAPLATPAAAAAARTPAAPLPTPEGIAAIGNVLGAMVGKVVEWNAAAQREVVSLGTGVAGALRLSPLGKPPAALPGSPRRTNMMCRICEEMVAIGRMEEHSRACALADLAESGAASMEDRLAALAEALEARGRADDDAAAAAPPPPPPVPPAAARQPGTSSVSAPEASAAEARASREQLVRCAVCVAELAADGSAGAAAECAQHLGVLRGALAEDAARATGGSETVQTFGRRMETLVVAQLQRLEEDAAAFAAAGGAMTADGCPPTPSRDGSPYGGAKPPNGMALDDYDILKPISRGAFGRVMLARKRTTGDLFALKVLRKRDLIRKNLMQAALAERDALARGGANPFVIRLFYTFTTSNSLYLVMEYAPGGDCYSLLRSLGCLEEPMVRTYAAEVVLALEYCHARGVVHRDLKPDNLLVSASGHLKLADFGLSLVGLADQANDELGALCGGGGLGSSGSSGGSLAGLAGCPPSPLALPAAAHLNGFGGPSRTTSLGLDGLPLGGGPGAAAQAATAAAAAASGLNPLLSNAAAFSPPRSPAPRGAGGCVGTPDYLAPEILLGTGHGVEADWWALGVILYEFLTGVPPFNARTPQAIFDNILNRKLRWPGPPDGEPLSPAAVALIDALMTSDPAARLGHAGGASEVKAHPFFEGLDWEQLARQKHEAAFVPVTESDTDTSYFVPRGRSRHSTAAAASASGRGSGSWGGGRSGSWGGGRSSSSWGRRRGSMELFSSQLSEDDGAPGDASARAGRGGGGGQAGVEFEGDDGDMAGCGFGIGPGGGGGDHDGLWNIQAANLFFANFSFKNLSQLATFNLDLLVRHHQAEKAEQGNKAQAAAADAAASAAAAAAAAEAEATAPHTPPPVGSDAPADSGGGFARLTPSGGGEESPQSDAGSVGSATPPPLAAVAGGRPVSDAPRGASE